MGEYTYPAALPVTTTGGWARPGWWDVVADGEKAGRVGPADRADVVASNGYIHAELIDELRALGA